MFIGKDVIASAAFASQDTIGVDNSKSRIKAMVQTFPKPTQYQGNLLKDGLSIWFVLG